MRWIMSLLRRAVIIFSFMVLPAVAQAQSFATVSIRLSGTGNPRGARVQVSPNGDLTARAISVAALVSDAYDVPVNDSPLLSPAFPKWVVVEKYDIDAKASANATPPGSLQDS